MKIQIKNIRLACEMVLTSGGISKKNAAVIVNDYVEGEMLGKPSHGLLAFTTAYEQAIKERHKNVVIEKNKGVYALINGNHQAGQLVAEKATHLVVQKAKKHGIGIVGTRNARTMLRPGSLAETISRHDLIAVVFHNGGGPIVVPYGGIDPITSTSPIGYGIPTKKDPIVVDMAVSERAWGETRVAKNEGRRLPPNIYINKQGTFTRDPDEAYAVVPFGGYKGFAIGILVEVLSGPLVNAGVGLSKSYYRSDPPRDSVLGHKVGKAYRGALFIAIDPTMFVDMQTFKRDTSKLVSQLKQSRPLPGVKEIRIPGEKAYATKALCKERGWFDVADETVETLRNIFLDYDVSF